MCRAPGGRAVKACQPGELRPGGRAASVLVAFKRGLSVLLSRALQGFVRVLPLAQAAGEAQRRLEGPQGPVPPSHLRPDAAGARMLHAEPIELERGQG